jgi:hypothetical protein
VFFLFPTLTQDIVGFVVKFGPFLGSEQKTKFNNETRHISGQSWKTEKPLVNTLLTKKASLLD